MTLPLPEVTRLPATPGVYRFRDASGHVLYMGRAVELLRRVRSYWGDLRERAHLTGMVARIARLEAVICDSEHEAAWLERNLLEHSMPRWNRTPGGQETPVYLRLDPDPSNPSLTVTHSVAGTLRHFGPYLGGDRVRLALSALRRVLPVAYAGDRLTASERAIAKTRGIVPADRERLVDALTCTLDRRPDAVLATRHALDSQRERASQALAFELAARLQTEAQALAWLVSPQRVTTQDLSARDVAGWVDGVLVRFTITGGRMRTWTQRSCSSAQARRHLAATPSEWTEFAQRNAELAVRLRPTPRSTATSLIRTGSSERSRVR